MIKVIDDSGINKGTINTLNIIYDTYESDSKKICIFNNFINNKNVMSELKELGVEVISNKDEITTNDLVIINPYGLNTNIIKYLEENNIKYIDTSCSEIKKLKEEVENKYNSNYEIIIISKDNIFRENVASWCNNDCLLFGNVEELNNLDNFNNKLIIDNINMSKSDLNSIKNKCNNITMEIIKFSWKQNIQKELEYDTIVIYQQDEYISKEQDVYYFSNMKEFINYVLNNDFNEDIVIKGSLNTTIKEVYNYKYLLTFLTYYKDILKELKSNQKNVNEKLVDIKDHSLIKDVTDYVSYLNNDGKYLRAVLIALGESIASNGKNHNYLNLAYAYELFQTAILIHDDIIDNAKLRRGKETLPRSICQKYLNLKNNKDYQQDVLKLANSLAICAGDFGLYEANEIIVDNYSNHPSFSKILELFNNIVIKTIKGEILDVKLPFLSKYNYKDVKEQDVIEIYHLKTSWYTTIGPFSLGYLLEDKNISKELENVLNKIGIAFQIQDDLLGIFSNNKEIGKQNTLDIEEFKQTLLYTYIVNTDYKDEFLKIYGKRNINNKKIIKLRELLLTSGAYDYVFDYLNTINSEYMDSIDNLEINNEGKDILKGLMIYNSSREK